METVLRGQDGGTGESDLLQRLLRNRRRSGRHGGMHPAGMTALWKTIHLRHILGAVVGVVLHRDAR